MSGRTFIIILCLILNVVVVCVVVGAVAFVLLLILLLYCGDFLSLTYLLGAGNTMTILTPDDSTYNHGWVAVHDIESMVFRVLTCADAHIALATNVGAFDEAYEVIIGGFNNTMSSIRYNKNGQSMVNVTTKGVLSCFMPREFWISWRDGSINVGRGGEVFVNTFLSWRDLEPDEVNVMQVSSGNGNRAAWVFVESDCKSSESKVLEKSSILPLIINNQYIDRHLKINLEVILATLTSGSYSLILRSFNICSILYSKSGLLHYLQLASHKIATIGINVTKNQIPNQNAYLVRPAQNSLDPPSEKGHLRRWVLRMYQSSTNQKLRYTSHHLNDTFTDVNQF